MLQFVFGKSGTGKTTWINNKISSLVAENNNKIMLVVPDQSTFESEKAFLNLLGAKKAKNILIFGFSRLCSYVFEHTGFSTDNVIDDGTRAVIMDIAIEQLTEKLELFGKKNSQATAKLLLSTMNECKNSAITANQLRNVCESISDETLKKKLCETALVFDTFDAILSQSYVDPLDYPQRLIEILLKNNIFDGYTIFIDSFSGFNSVQLKIIRLLILQSADTYISLTLDPLSNGNEDVFATSQKTCKKIKRFEGIQIKPPIKLTENHRFANSELTALESGIFRSDYSTFDNNPSAITAYEACDPYDECEFVARSIKKLIVENGYLYSDITVICRDLSLYQGTINTIFEKYNIPYFMDAHNDLEVKPVIRFVSSLFKIILNNFEREDVLSLLKTGLTQNSEMSISCFENYVFVWNINHSGFKKVFQNNPQGFKTDFSENDKNLLAVCEHTRKSVVEPILDFKDKIKDKNGKEITGMLYELLVSMGVPKQLQNMYNSFEMQAKKDTGAQQIKIWNLFMNVLDKMVAVTGENFMTVKRYFELLSTQISFMKLSEIPRTVDSVVITNAQRVRLSKQKVSFLTGCIDGVFPAVAHSTGVFSPYELKMITNEDFHMGDDFSDISNLETFMAYNSMTSPSEKLYLSYYSADLSGNTFLPSSIFAECKKIFPHMIMLDKADFCETENFMWSEQSAFEFLAKNYSAHSEKYKKLYNYFSKNEKYSLKLDALSRAVKSEPFEIVNSQNAKSLFGEHLNISASQIEKFSMCRFSYFCNYGLNIKQRMKAEINPLEYGTLVHFLLEKFFTAFDKSQFSNLSDEEITNFVNSTVMQYLSDKMGGSDDKSNSFVYRLSIISNNVCLLLKHIIKELSQSDFAVADCELKIGNDIPAYTINLPNGHKISVRGSVDRVDVMEKDGVKYLRVIDYKTNQKEFKLSDILYGLNLQMLLYLYSIKNNSDEKYGKILPAGILYMPATVPVISSDKLLDAKTLEKEIDKKLKMNGLILFDVDAVSGMDKTLKETYIPASVKLGVPVSKNGLATIEQFGKIFEKIDYTVAQMGQNLYSGQIQASPVKGAHDACEYCPYDSVCAYRQSKPVNTFSVDNAEVYKKIDEQIEKSGDEQ